jgi:Zn-dependent M28 family amino/carboxypeptidase
LPPVFGLPVLDAGRSLPDTRRSDHAPFWDRGLPAMLLTDTAELRSDRYHQTTDTLEGIDADFLAGNAQTLANALATLLNEPPLPP